MTRYLAVIFGLIWLFMAVLAAAAMAADRSAVERLKNGVKGCSGCNLFQADLSYTDLKGVDLSKARLKQANLTASVAAQGNFSSADLSYAELYAAVLTGASLRGANLTRASLVGAWLQGADFTGAKLQDADLSGAKLTRVIGLTQAQLDQACGNETTMLPSGMSIRGCR